MRFLFLPDQAGVEVAGMKMRLQLLMPSAVLHLRKLKMSKRGRRNLKRLGRRKLHPQPIVRSLPEKLASAVKNFVIN